MVIGLLTGCNNGLAEELEKRNTFFESVSKIGQGFQDIFGIFGNAMGDALGFSAVKSEDNRGKVGDHFDKVKKGLTDTNGKLKELEGKIFSTKNVDGNTTKIIEEAIKGANRVFDKLIDALTKLAEVAKGASSHKIYDNNATNAAGADQKDVNTIIENVKEIIKVAKQSGVEIKAGDSGDTVNTTEGPKALTHNAQASVGDATKLADIVSKADAWAMIDKIKDATAVAATDTPLGASSAAGTLAASGKGNNTAGSAKTTADLAAAVALKAMTKSGKFVQPAANEDGALKAAAVGAVNKVIGVLDEIIRRTVASELCKVGKAVNGMQYSENTEEKSAGATK